MTDIVAEAMLALRSREPQRAIALLESAPGEIAQTEGAQRVLAAGYAEQGNLDGATQLVQRLLERPTLELATRAVMGRICLDAGDTDHAFEQFDLLVQHHAGQLAFWRYLWICARTPAQFDRALRRTLRGLPDQTADVLVATSVTRALTAAGQVRQALQLARATVLRHPGSTAARWTWLHTVVDETPLEAWEELAGAPLDFVTALPAAMPLDADATDTALHVPEQYPDERMIDAWRARYGEGLDAIQSRLSQTPLTAEQRSTLFRHSAFRITYQNRNDLDLQTRRGALLHALLQPLAVDLDRTPRTASRTGRLRVAFVSSHVRDCTVGHYFRRFMTDLADARIDVSVFALGMRDAFTDSIAAQVPVSSLPLDAHALPRVIEAIALARPDVLIYPEVGLDARIEALAAMRLAPLQCALWGHPVTTGLPTMDVFFSADAIEPADAPSHYREALHRLPGLGTCYPRPPQPSAASRANLGLPSEGMLVVCAQLPLKWLPHFGDAVARILNRVPDATLVVFDPPVAARGHAFDAWLRRFFEPHGVSLEHRVTRLAQRDRVDFIATLQHCDLALDTFGFSGGNTSLDALSCGLPVLTLPGAFMRGRQTMAMLRRVSEDVASELVASDVDDYVERAVDLLDDHARRNALRLSIRAGASALFDDPGVVPALRERLLALCAWQTAQA